jgi:hypothetical protein
LSRYRHESGQARYRIESFNEIATARFGQPRVSANETNRPDYCGGIPGSYELLEAIANPAHPSHAHIKEGAGDYDPPTSDTLPIKHALSRMANRRNTSGRASPRKSISAWLPDRALYRRVA